MAQLTWREVQAPNLSTRDMALAGNQIGQSFDRLGELLIRREDNLRKDATNSAAAAAYMAGTPEEIAALRSQQFANLDPRVDRLAYAQALGLAQNQMTERLKAQGEIDQIESQRWGGVFAGRMVDAAGDGNRAELDRIRAEMEADEKAKKYLGFVLPGYTKEAEGVYHNTETRNEIKADNERQARDRAAGRALQARELALRQQAVQEAHTERQQRELGANAALQLAERTRTMDKDSALATVYESDTYKNMSSTARSALMEGFGAAHAAFTGETASTRAGLPNLEARKLQLDAQANAAANQAEDPALAGLRAAGNYGNITMTELVDELSKRGGWQAARGFTKPAIDKILADATVTVKNPDGTTRVVRPSLADIRGAVDANGFAEGGWKNIPYWGLVNLGMEHGRLTGQVRQIVEQRAKGYTANAELDVVAARAPFESTKKELDDTRTQLNRYLRSYERGQLSPTEMLEMDRLEKRLAELAKTDTR